jgi:hypothetical protein
MNVERKNCYICDTCGSYIVTIDVDEGVTPMFWGDCPTIGCCGTQSSCMYNAGMLRARIPETGGNWALMTPTWEWYKPSAHEYEGLSPSMRDHVDRGGLCRRAIEGGKS